MDWISTSYTCSLPSHPLAAAGSLNIPAPPWAKDIDESALMLQVCPPTGVPRSLENVLPP